MLKRTLAAMMIVGLALPDAAALAAEAAARTSVVRVIPATPSMPVVAATSVYKTEEPARRPAVLPALYAGLGILQSLDVYTTAAAIKNGAREANPVMAPIAGNKPAMFAVKAASTTVSIYFAERLWKKNRVAAVAVMIGVNAATAAVVANNMNNARARK